MFRYVCCTCKYAYGYKKNHSVNTVRVKKYRFVIDPVRKQPSNTLCVNIIQYFNNHRKTQKVYVRETIF